MGGPRLFAAKSQYFESSVKFTFLRDWLQFLDKDQAWSELQMVHFIHWSEFPKYLNRALKVVRYCHFFIVPKEGHWGVGIKWQTSFGIKISKSHTFWVGWHATPGVQQVGCTLLGNLFILSKIHMKMEFFLTKNGYFVGNLICIATITYFWRFLSLVFISV